jgi:hypothetical protein
MSLTDKLLDCIQNNILDKACDIIKLIFKKNKEINNVYTCKYYDDRIKNIIVSWLKNDIYNDDGAIKSIEFYICLRNIFNEQHVNVLLKNSELLIILCEETIIDISKCNNQDVIKKLFNNILDNGFIPNKEQFFEIINNQEYRDILSTKNIVNILNTKYKSDAFELMMWNFNKNAYDLMFCDCKYNEEELLRIFTGKPEMLQHVLSKIQLKENIKIDEKYFEIIIYYNIFSPIANLIKNNYIVNLDKCFRLFWDKIEKCIITNMDNTSHHSLVYISKNEVVNFLNIYKIFIESGIYVHNYHFDVFFKKGWIDFIDFLIKEKKIYPTKNNFESYVTHTINDNTCNEYFPELNFSEEELYLACLNKRVNIIKIILEQKIIPTHRCFCAILEKINNNIAISFLELNNIKTTIDHFIHYSYYLTNDDILLLTKKKIIINNSFFTKNLKFNDDEKEEFYSYCDLDFMPEYNDTLFNDILWLRRMCKTAKRADDYKIIKQFVKRTKLNIDFICYVYLMNNYNHNKMKDELLAMYNKD